ncbi:hypothetical protein CTI12_AA094560 [Artemisia annua]|uniref:B3 domain-containing protein n=1 Tax=Artemisia annua TaxID=35608 RepID=A0A2U1PZ53_ARTAN|nr:hypothetical protein CTI12_AA094560 [Artemisia annua]
MKKNVGNADRHDQNITNEEVGSAASKHDADIVLDQDVEEYYYRKIVALVNEKYNQFLNGELVMSDESSSDESDEQMESICRSKRKGSSMDEVDNKNKKVKMVVDRDDVITQLQEFIMSDEINGSDIKLVIQKMVCTRRIATQNWLNMPFKKVETHDFLTPEEKQVLGDGSEIEVPLVGPDYQMYKKPMSLKIGGKWRNKNYILKTNWSDFVEANKNVLKEGTAIQVWSFRKGEQLCFAVVSVWTNPW